MIRQIPMYLVLAAHLALLVLCWFVPPWFDWEWVLLCCATPQALMLAMWLVLGRANILVRLLVNAVALCYWAQFIAHDFFTDEIVAYLSLLLAVIVGATGVTRVLGWRIEKVQSEKLSDQTGIRPRHLQFTLRTVALLVSAISVLFAINVRLKFVAVVFGSDAWTAIFLLTAISSVLALWATLGEGRLAVRLLIYASVATAGITGVIVTDPMFAKNFEVVLTYLVPDVLVIPLTLLAFRIAGYRVARQATESTNGEATVAVVSP